MTWLMVIMTFCSGAAFKTVSMQQRCIRDLHLCEIRAHDDDPDMAAISALICVERYKQ